MLIGMNIMLSFAVYKLRLGDDVPVQSDLTPLINHYFILCMAFSLASMLWFSIRYLLVQMDELPVWLQYLIKNYICFLVFLKKYEDLNDKIKNFIKEKNLYELNKKKGDINWDGPPAYYLEFMDKSKYLMRLEPNPNTHLGSFSKLFQSILTILK